MSFENVPLIVIEQDPDRCTSPERFVDGFGIEKPAEAGEHLLAGWPCLLRRALDRTRARVIANGSGLDMVIWDQPDLVIEQILDLLRR